MPHDAGAYHRLLTPAMPTRAPTVCRAPGCPNANPCPQHPATRWAAGARGRTMPPGWPATRARILLRDHHTCQIDGPDCTRYATEVDHLTPGVETDDHLRAVCTTCHRTKTQTEARAGKELHR